MTTVTPGGLAPETRIALANLDVIAEGSALLVGPDAHLAAAVNERADQVTVFHTDLRSFRACAGVADDVRFGAWLDGDHRYDVALLLMPKEIDRLRMLLAMVRPSLAPGGRLVLIGHNKSGIRQAERHLREWLAEPEVLDFRAHCRAYLTTARDGYEPSSPEQWSGEFEEIVAGSRLRVRDYPGVFARGRIDQGTRALLSSARLEEGARVLDVGSGNGVIAASLGQGGARVDAVDVDALALLATKETLALNGAEGRVFPSDVYTDVEGAYTHIVSNPPFHAGQRQTTLAGRRLIEEAPEHLEHGGELWLVANRFLPYPTLLQHAFGVVDVVHEDPRYRVYRARRS